MPGFYKPGEYDIAGFAVGAVDKDQLIDGSGIAAGNVLIGVAASGLHSNGYSLTRKIVFEHVGMKLTDYVDEWGCTVADELLKPTRIYVKLVQKVLAAQAKLGVKINGMSHITGGGLLENPNRVLPKGLALELDWGSWPILPVFGWLQSKGNVDALEMLRTYNMGIGFCFYVAADQAPALLAYFAEQGEEGWQIGRVVEGNGSVAVCGLED
jgi:phosphoribosylformylglycinamidine cyclo-ligase